MDWLKRLSRLRDDGQNKCKGMTKKEAGTFVSDTGGTFHSDTIKLTLCHRIMLHENQGKAHWIYFVCICVLGIVAYILFMKRYYHLHEEYLRGLK